MTTYEKIEAKLTQFDKAHASYIKPSKILMSQDILDALVKEFDPYMMDYDDAKKVNHTIKNDETNEYKGIPIEIVPEFETIVVM